MSTKISAIEIFVGVNMSYQHDGLKKIASRRGVSIDTLKSSECVVFLNRDLTRAKIYTADKTLMYQRRDPTRPFDIVALSQFPQFFGGELDYDKSLLLRLRDAFAKKGLKDLAKV